MHILSFNIHDVKCFRPNQSFVFDGSLHPTPRWVVIAGRNGTGKTTILKAIAMAIVGVQPATALEIGMGGWIARGRVEGAISVQLSYDPRWDRFLGVGAIPKKLNRSFFTSLDIHKVDHTDRERLSENVSLAEVAAKMGLTSAKKAAQRGPWAAAPQGWFVCGYGPFRHLGPLGVEQLRLNKDPQLARLISLFHEGATLVESVEWLQFLHLRALEGREGEKRLKAQVLRLLNDGLLPDGSTVDYVNSEGMWILSRGDWHLLQTVSDGYRTVAALVLDIVRHLYGCYGDALTFEEMNGHWACALPGVVLIDEVDAHMHISWQQRIGFWLCDHFPGLQFIVTTHSPFICQAASPGALIRLPAPGEDRQIEVVPENIYKIVTQGTVDAAVITELFGLEHAHSPRAEETRSKLAALEARLLNEEALSPEEEAEWEHLKQKLPETLSDLADQQFRAALYEED